MTLRPITEIAQDIRAHAEAEADARVAAVLHLHADALASIGDQLKREREPQPGRSIGWPGAHLGVDGKFY
ncbi:MAG: hypothetical protein ACOY3N_23510 [Bradyrhizobium sp.]|uniref:hypothetical protein n=1 Tax=Bradyrhizobium sp. TaxID=376 RepID=UPI003BF217B0